MDVEPVFGYLHRGSEKLAEERNYVQVITLTDRLDYVASMTNNPGLLHSRGEADGHRGAREGPSTFGLSRQSFNALPAISSPSGFFLQDLGALGTPLMYCFRERERILDLFEMLCGARITVSYMRPGGVYIDTPDDFWPALRQLLQDMPSYIGELEQLLVENEIIMVRVKGCESSSAGAGHSLPPPADRWLRASGLRWDWRKADPYDVYDQVEFDVPVGSNGDNLDRFWVRMQEIHQSLRIIEQCVEQIPDGPVRAKLPLVLRPPAGADAYGRIESPKGELGLLPGERWQYCAVPLQNTLSLPIESNGDPRPAGGLEAGGHGR